MLGLPITVAVSLVLVFMFGRAALRGAPWPLLALLGLLVGQGVLLAFARDWTFGRAIFASLVPPLTILAFRSTTSRIEFDQKRAAMLAVGPTVVLLSELLFPDALDPALFLWFSGHGVAILYGLRERGSLSTVPLSELRMARLVWGGAGGALLFSALVDLIIAITIALGTVLRVQLIIDLSAVGFLTGLAAIVLVAEQLPKDGDMAKGEPANNGQNNDIDVKPQIRLSDQEAQAIVQRADIRMRTGNVWRDPGLSLRRLAKKVQIPEKKLSAAINQRTGDSVSRFVLQYRIKDACERLDEGLSVTEAMLQAGFSTKSHFNAEFKRITSMTPSSWITRSRDD